MKVILNQTVPKVGKQGDVVTVADGYARNFLFPRKLAILADKTQLAAHAKRTERTLAKVAEGKAQAEGTRETLHGKVVRIEAKVGKDGGKLFGAITSQDVADAIKKQLGVAVEKKQVALIEPIKRLGNFPIEVDLHRQVDAIVTVEVFDPEAPQVAQVAVEAAEVAEPVA